MAGDFNAKAIEWGSTVEDGRGVELAEWMSGLSIVVLNRGGRPTFVRNGRGSYIDVTMCSENVVSRITNWRVLTEETLGWHQLISYEYREPKRREVPQRITRGWRINDNNLKLFGQKIAEWASKEIAGGGCV